MSTSLPRPTFDRCLGRAARQALAAAAPVDLDRLAEALLGSEMVDLELWVRLGASHTRSSEETT
jgi:hypothetical protein